MGEDVVDAEGVVEGEGGRIFFAVFVVDGVAGSGLVGGVAGGVVKGFDFSEHPVHEGC